MTAQPFIHGRTGGGANNPPSGAGVDYTFRAPRHSDLVTCPYCGGDSLDRCDWCGDEGTIFADEFFDEE